MTSSSFSSVAAAALPSLITAAFRADNPAPVILLADQEVDQDAVLSAAFHVARSGDRPFALLPCDSVESDGLAAVCLTVADLAQAARGMAVPHGAGSPVQIQQSQSLIATLRALGTAQRNVVVIKLAGTESAQEMTLALSALGEPHANVAVDLTRASVFWCGPTAQSLPAAYRNACQVFGLEVAPPRPPSP
jgi:hypothetical protein